MEAAKGVGDGLTEVGDGSRSGGAKRSFELGERHSDGIEVGAIWRQVSQARPGGLDRLSGAMNLVRGQIVHDHDVARPQLGSERLFDIGEKGLTVHRAVEDHGSSDAVGTQPGGEGGGFPMAMGHGGAAWLAPARRVRRAAALFGGMRGLFLRVILRRLKNRQSVPMATATPRSFSRSRSSASVISLLAATAERISSACASIRCEWRSPPWSLGLISPSRCSRARHRIALDAPTPNRGAAARHDNPPSIASTTRRRRSTDKDLAMHASLLRRQKA